MENTTDFELSSALQRWRENLAKSPNFRPGDLEELESHLHDSIVAWQAKGLSTEEAFLIAARRLGHAGCLASEFAKVNPKEVWLDRVMWMVIGVQLLWVLTNVSSLIARWFAFGALAAFGWNLRPGPAQLLSAGLFPGALITLIQISMFLLGVWAIWHFLQRKNRALISLTTRLLHRRFLLLLIAVGASLLFLRFLTTLDILLLTKWYSKELHAYVSYSWSIANFFLSIATSIGLPALTLILIRRRLRSGEGVRIAGQPG